MFKFDFLDKETMEMVGKQVVIECADGDEISGRVVGFTSDKDNDFGVASVDLVLGKFNTCVSVFENEILTIETELL